MWPEPLEEIKIPAGSVCWVDSGWDSSSNSATSLKFKSDLSRSKSQEPMRVRLHKGIFYLLLFITRPRDVFKDLAEHL